MWIACMKNPILRLIPFRWPRTFIFGSDRRDSVYRMICESPLAEPEYLYSDLGYYMLQQVLEQETDTMLYPYCWYKFYAPMGANTLGFLPLNRFPQGKGLFPQKMICFSGDS